MTVYCSKNWIYLSFHPVLLQKNVKLVVLVLQCKDWTDPLVLELFH